ncbi:hypothetical protein ACOMHN_049807 [Nucella lapillus]
MLGTMASFGAWRDSPSPLPLALTLNPADGRVHPALQQNPFLHRPHHSLLYGHPAAHTFADPIRRLALARLPPPRRPASGTNPKPFTSFCIKDILGGEAEREEEEPASSSSSRPLDATTTSPFKPVSSSSRTSSGISPTTTSGGGTTLGGKIRATSRSPTNQPPSSKASRGGASPRMPPSAVPSVSLNGARIVRPWDPSPSSPDTEISSDDGVDTYQDSALENEEEEEEEEISVDDEEPPSVRLGLSKGDKSGVSPLDALMAMTSKTFEGLDAPDSAGEL